MVDPDSRTAADYYVVARWFVDDVMRVRASGALSLSEYLTRKPLRFKKRMLAGSLDRVCNGRKPCNRLFIKQELRASWASFKARVINDVAPRWSVLYGVWCSAFSGWLRATGQPFFAYYLTLWELEHEFRGYVDGDLFMDFSTFDLSLSEVFFRAEMYFLVKLGLPVTLAKSLFLADCKWSGKFRNKDSELRMRCDGRCRQTGDPQTSIANNFAAITAHLYVYAHIWMERSGCDLNAVLHSVAFSSFSWLHLLNNGDDSYHSVRGVRYPVPADYVPLGLTVKPSRSFCKLYPVHDGRRTRLVRDPADFLVRFGFSRHYLRTDLERRMALRGNCVGYSYFTSGVPLYWVLISSCMRLTRGVVACRPDLASHTLTSLIANLDEVEYQPQLPPTAAMRRSFAHAFGIPIAKQLELEGSIARLSDQYALVGDYDLMAWLAERNEYPGGVAGDGPGFGKTKDYDRSSEGNEG
jgi:hypothetical protein